MAKEDCERLWALADLLPFNAAIDYWCNKEPGCLKAKKHALIAAVANGNVAYQWLDGRSWAPTIADLYQSQKILVKLDSFNAWAATVSSKKEKARLQETMPINIRAETTYLNIIGAMTELMLGKSKMGDDNSVFKNQSAIVTSILEKFESKPGISQRSLDDKLAQARKSITSI